MPGSILNLLDIGSDHSDCSTKSIDSRTSGKKVSFNKAVRVKQYPWQPDEYLDNDSTATLPSQRFWFKVYKTNPSSSDQNTWKDSNDLLPKYAEDGIDSLTPIAEDDGPLSDRDFPSPKHSQLREVSANFYDAESIPFEPPVDYMDDNEIPEYDNRYNIRNDVENNILNGGTSTGYGIRSRQKELSKNSKQIDLKSNSINGVVPCIKYQDFKRPTISSAAKCITEPKLSLITKKQVRSNKNQGKNSTNDASNRNFFNSPSSEKIRERRSRSTDSELKDERLLRGTIKVDKAVSTDDLSADSKTNEESLSKNCLWWAHKKSIDKSTQCSGTLTNINRRGVNHLIGTENYRSSFLSASCQTPNTTVSDFSSQLLSPEKRILKGTGLELNNKVDHKPLSLSGKTLSSGNQTKNNIGNSVTETIYYSIGKNEDQTRNVSNGFLKLKDEIDNKQRPFPWKTVRNRKYSARKENNNPDLSPVETNDLKSSSSTVGYVRGRQISFVPSPSISIPKIARKNDNASSKNIYDRQDMAMGRNGLTIETPLRERSLSSDRAYNRYKQMDDCPPMIDWSLSEFRLGSRQDSKMSSSSDSECVVHRRPPLLMYIPGVSHHNRPAIEDDRLSAFSGISRSEAEDEVSPLIRIQSNEFKRRHSMPRNGKLHWMKWKTSKNSQQA